MRLPRDLSGPQLVKALEGFGYRVTRQTGSHIRLTTSEPSKHHVTVPNHSALRVGTLGAILDAVAVHQDLTRDELLRRLVDA